MKINKKNILMGIIIVITIILTVTIISLYNINNNMLVDNSVEYKTRADIPEIYKWNLADIYKSQFDWEEEIQKVKSLATTFESLRDDFGKSIASTKATLDKYTEIRLHTDRIYNYAYMENLIDKFDETGIDNLNKAQQLQGYVRGKSSWLIPSLLSLNPNYLSATTLSEYKPLILDTIKNHSENLASDENNLINNFARIENFPNSVHETLMYEMSIPKVQGNNGSDTLLSYPNFIAIMQSTNRNIRKDAFTKYYSSYDQYKNTFAELLLNKVGYNTLNAKLRKYNNPLEASLASEAISTNVFNDLISSMDASLPLFHKYFDLKSNALDVEKLHMYDIYAPVGRVKNKYITYEEAQIMIKGALHPLGKDYIDIVQKAFDEQWIDVYNTQNKESNSLQVDLYGVHPFILINYEGTQSDVNTLAHEMGHAVQSYMTSKTNHYLNVSLPNFLIEVPSNLNEILLCEFLYKNAKNKNEKIYYLDQYLEKFRINYFRPTQLSEFEKIIYQEPQTLISLMNNYEKLNKKYYGNNVESDELIRLEWTRLSSLYTNFSNFRYPTSFSIAMVLAEEISQNPKAVTALQDLYTAGSYASPTEVLSKHNIVLDSSIYEKTMKRYQELIEDYEKLTQ